MLTEMRRTHWTGDKEAAGPEGWSDAIFLVNSVPNGFVAVGGRGWGDIAVPFELGLD
jgi:hypothetical protein